MSQSAWVWCSVCPKLLEHGPHLSGIFSIIQPTGFTLNYYTQQKTRIWISPRLLDFVTQHVLSHTANSNCLDIHLMQLQPAVAPQRHVSEQRGGVQEDGARAHVQLEDSTPSSRDLWLPWLDSHMRTVEPGNILPSDHWDPSVGPWDLYMQWILFINLEVNYMLHFHMCLVWANKHNSNSWVLLSPAMYDISSSHNGKKITVSGDVMPHSFVDRYRSFREMFCPHLPP